VKHKFYNILEWEISKIPKYHVPIIMGDFNAKIGKEEYLDPIAGRHSLHEESSENGRLLGQMALSNGLIIMSTRFPHKEIHKGTWKMPGSEVVNQSDDVLVSGRHSSFIQDVRTARGPNCDSDHFLVMVNFKRTERTENCSHHRTDNLLR
jgi:endonuclease/exonuclease/phosphatase family metal-dependent hydrolase